MRSPERSVNAPAPSPDISTVSNRPEPAFTTAAATWAESSLPPTELFFSVVSAVGVGEAVADELGLLEVGVDRVEGDPPPQPARAMTAIEIAETAAKPRRRGR